jgi:hypothetical protein
MYTHTHPVDQSGLVRYDFQTGQFSPVFASLYEPQKLDDLPVFHRFIRKKKTGRLPAGPVRSGFNFSIPVSALLCDICFILDAFETSLHANTRVT